MSGHLLSGMHFIDSVFSSCQNIILNLNTDIPGFDDGFSLSVLLHIFEVSNYIIYLILKFIVYHKNILFILIHKN